jgi:hypothetical protein
VGRPAQFGAPTAIRPDRTPEATFAYAASGQRKGYWQRRSLFGDSRLAHAFENGLELGQVRRVVAPRRPHKTHASSNNGMGMGKISVQPQRMFAFDDTCAVRLVHASTRPNHTYGRAHGPGPRTRLGSASLRQPQGRHWISHKGICAFGHVCDRLPGSFDGPWCASIAGSIKSRLKPQSRESVRSSSAPARPAVAGDVRDQDRGKFAGSRHGTRPHAPCTIAQNPAGAAVERQWQLGSCPMPAACLVNFASAQ